MAAQTVEFHGAAPAPWVENKISAIRAALPARLQRRFQAELDEAADSGNLQKIDAFKSRWWPQAMLAADPTIREDFDALDRGELHEIPSPLAHR